ncbi:membrane-associated kinase regulator 5-like [Solanum dulcamara]|uniref:membrane-associated kinase regulator 5-like n=1 Tax=Solanum dulcamara TaxID=45834 RepID=UPI002485C88B|nr:membrane-associated kinase regulator 5-like [Solanum dulcamara]
MESFNFLKFWRTAPVRDIDCDFDSVKKFADSVDYKGNPAPTETTDEEIDEEGDSFFDLVFTTGINGHPKVNNNPTNSISEKGFSSVKLEKPENVFFPIDANPKPHSPNSILPSAPKFSVCFLGFRKSKPEKVGIDDSSTASRNIQTQKRKVELVRDSKCFTVKCQVEERESSINDSSKQFARADMGKYFKLMKPLYSRASKRFTERSHLLSSPSVQSLSLPRNSSEEKHGNRAAVLMAVRKRLGKSRSTAPSFAGASTSPMSRRDDSLLEQNDGIQSAILHCKRSYSSSARKDCSVLLPRNSNEDLSRGSCEEQNRWSI